MPTTPTVPDTGTLRVLLLSPVRELDPPNGDVTYTEELKADPPEGVRYTTYADALRDGSLIRIDRHSAGWRPAVIRNIAVNRLRRLGVLFREPFGYFAVQPGHFDLVHVHCFSVRLGGAPLPVLLTNAAPIEHVYRDVHHWSRTRVRWAAWCDRRISELTGVQHSTYVTHGPSVIGSFTATMAGWRAGRHGADPGTVLPNFTPRRPAAAQPSEPTIGLVAAQPEVKGVDVFLEAVRRLRRDHPRTGTGVRFLVIGDLAGREDLRAACRELGVETRPRVPRQQLLDGVLPTLTALAYPSRFDGSPFVVLEALAQGVPVLTSDYFAMPEIVGGHGRGGLVHRVGDSAALAEHMLAVLEPEVAARLAAGARRRHAEAFAADVCRPQLRSAYADAVRINAGKATEEALA